MTPRPPVFNQTINGSAGRVRGLIPASRSGRSTNVDSVPTDLWDRANAVDDQAIWVPPTDARIHNIVSSSADDADAGTGAHTIILLGLTDWDTPEVNEIIELDGLTPVATTRPYVIVNRIIILTWGAAGPNVGTVTATAAVDATVSAQVNPGVGQSLMGILGVPSGQTLYANKYWGSVQKANLGSTEVHADLSLLAWLDAGTNPEGYIFGPTIGLGSQGASPFTQSFDPYLSCPGPCVIKMQAIGSTVNLDISGGFDGYVLFDR